MRVYRVKLISILCWLQLPSLRIFNSQGLYHDPSKAPPALWPLDLKRLALNHTSPGSSVIAALLVSCSQLERLNIWWAEPYDRQEERGERAISIVYRDI